ncbi:hypothetical protein EDB80DRAFT_728795 [Ilyonectria destructans]|nr:hypothetical protein EDB80DRAFT_728795 [Ilyonectria destructans]
MALTQRSCSKLCRVLSVSLVAIHWSLLASRGDRCGKHNCAEELSAVAFSETRACAVKLRIILRENSPYIR